MNIVIREAQSSDFDQYSNLLQQTYETCCVNNSIGLTKACFSKEMMSTEESVNFLRSYLKITPTHKAWVAALDGKIVGAISCEIKSQLEGEIVAFYVLPQYQDQGIGKQLYTKALDFVGQRDLVLDVYAHNEKTIAMYKKWGWELDVHRGDGGSFFLHWKGWPKEVQVKCLYMRCDRHNKL